MTIPMPMIAETMPENELILMAKTGNDRALGMLIRRHLSAAHGLCLRYLSNNDDAEDAVQEVFVKVWRNLHKIDPQKNFRAWTMEIAKNTCLDILKKKRTVPMSAFESEDGSNNFIESLESTCPSPIEMAEHSMLKRILDAATGKLSPAYQKVLNLYYGQGLNFREISETLNEPLHTIKSRHRRAIINLRLILANNE
jgi:RNA polymerase sigma-70 factor, ECF subfamily